MFQEKIDLKTIRLIGIYLAKKFKPKKLELKNQSACAQATLN